MGTTSDRTRTVARHPSAVLLIAQLGVVLLYPFLDGTAPGRAVVGVIQILVVLIAAWAVRNTPALSWVALVLGGPAMLLTIAEAISPDTDWVVLASAVFHVPFYLFVSYAMIRYLFEDEWVTRDELFAAGAAFTVVAWAFAYLYAAVQVIWPGSFVSYGNTPGSPDQMADPLPWFHLLFLSFTNLTSVGLSDIYPVVDHARSLVMVEQLAGVLYIALIVARLVGLTRRRPVRTDPPPHE